RAEGEAWRSCVLHGERAQAAAPAETDVDLHARILAPLPENRDPPDPHGSKHPGHGLAARQADARGHQALRGEPVDLEEPRQQRAERGLLSLGCEAGLARGLCHQRHRLGPSKRPRPQRKSLRAKAKIRSSERPDPTPWAKERSSAATSETSPSPAVTKLRSSPSRRSAPMRMGRTSSKKTSAPTW